MISYFAGPWRKLVTACFIALVCGVYFYDQRTPVEYKSGEIKSAWCDPKRADDPPAIIVKGGCVKPVIGLLWHRVDCSLEVARVVRDGAGADVKVASDHASATPADDAIGHITVSSRTIVVPADATPYIAPGPVPSYRAKMTLACGVLRKFVNPFVIDVGPIPFELKAS